MTVNDYILSYPCPGSLKGSTGFSSSIKGCTRRKLKPNISENKLIMTYYELSKECKGLTWRITICLSEVLSKVGTYEGVTLLLIAVSRTLESAKDRLGNAQLLSADEQSNRNIQSFKTGSKIIFPDLASLAIWESSFTLFTLFQLLWQQSHIINHFIFEQSS